MPRACVRSSPMSLSVLCHHLDSLVNLALRNEVDLVLDEHHRDVAALVLHLTGKQVNPGPLGRQQEDSQKTTILSVTQKMAQGSLKDKKDPKDEVESHLLPPLSDREQRGPVGC